MKKFICLTGIFLLVSLSVILTMVTVTIVIMSQASFRIDSNKNILILGTSLTAACIDDNIFIRSANLSEKGTAHMYSYCKLKKILENNQQIDTVLLSFSYLELTKEREDLWIMNEKFLVPRVSYSITLLGKEEFLVYNNKRVLLQAILKVPIRNAGSVVKYFLKGGKNFSYKDLRIGGYYKMNGSFVQRAIEKREQEFVLHPLVIEESPIIKEYLFKIVDCCKRHNVKLILLSPPIYKSERYGDMDKMYEYHSKYLNEIELLDYSNFIFPDESYYLDIMHLNHKGAEIFSNYLQENLVNDLKMQP